MQTKQTTIKVYQFPDHSMTVIRHLVYNDAGVRVGAVHEHRITGPEAVTFFDLFDVRDKRVMKSQFEIKRTRTLKAALNHLAKLWGNKVCATYVQGLGITAFNVNNGQCIAVVNNQSIAISTNGTGSALTQKVLDANKVSYTKARNCYTVTSHTAQQLIDMFSA